MLLGPEAAPVLLQPAGPAALPGDARCWSSGIADPGYPPRKSFGEKLKSSMRH